MIRTKQDLKEALNLEKEMYLCGKKCKHYIVRSKNYSIWKYLYFLRKEEYYGNNLNSIYNKILYCLYKRKKNLLGERLGFDIPRNCFDVGLKIFHISNVVVNAEARIGKNCKINGNVCIGYKDGAPCIGDNVNIGYGATIIGKVIIANDVKIGASSLVNKSCYETNAILVGIPAKKLNASCEKQMGEV